MLVIPQRQSFATRDDFAAAVSGVFGDLWDEYEVLIPLREAPEWTLIGRGKTVFNVSLPIAIARQGGDAHALSSLLKHMIEMKRSIVRISRIETASTWTVWAETDNGRTN